MLAERFVNLLEHLRELFPTIRPHEITYNDDLNLYWYYIGDRDLLCIYDPHLDVVRILYLYEPLYFDFRKDHLFVKEKSKAIYIPYDFGSHSCEQYIVDFTQHGPLWVPSSDKDIFIELFPEDNTLLIRFYSVDWNNLREYEIQDFRISSPRNTYRIKFDEDRTYIIKDVGSHYEFQLDLGGEFPEISYHFSHLTVGDQEIYPNITKKAFNVLERNIGTFGFSCGRFYYKFGKAIVRTSPFSSYPEDYPPPFSPFGD
jgi:hypothetical protein